MCIRELPDPDRREEQVSLVRNTEFRGLVRRCLQKTPSMRPTMQEIIDEEKNLINFPSSLYIKQHVKQLVAPLSVRYSDGRTLITRITQITRIPLQLTRNKSHFPWISPHSSVKFTRFTRTHITRTFPFPLSKIGVKMQCPTGMSSHQLFLLYNRLKH